MPGTVAIDVHVVETGVW